MTEAPESNDDVSNGNGDDEPTEDGRAGAEQVAEELKEQEEKIEAGEE